MNTLGIIIIIIIPVKSLGNLLCLKANVFHVSLPQERNGGGCKNTYTHTHAPDFGAEKTTWIYFKVSTMKTT